MKIFTLLLVIGWSLFVRAQTNCPSIEKDISSTSWQSSSPGLNCRSECKKDEDCEIFKDSCGRMLVVNKKFHNEIQHFVSLPVACPDKIDDSLKATAVCGKNRCAVKFLSCAQEKDNRLSFVKKHYVSDCNSDADCSFISLASDECRYEYPVSARSDSEKNKETLAYLNFRVGKSCSKISSTSCDKNKINQCFVGQCLRVAKRIEFVSYLNLEGVAARPNLKSRTKPLITATAEEIKCSTSKDCTVTSGVCGQNLLSVNTKNYNFLKQRVAEFEKKIACPPSTKEKVSSSACSQGYCLFLKEHD